MFFLPDISLRNINDYHLSPSLADGHEEHFTTLEALTPSPAHYRDSYEDDQRYKQDQYERDNSHYERYTDHVHETGQERFVEYIETIEHPPENLKYGISHMASGHGRLDITSHYIHQELQPRAHSANDSVRKSTQSEGKDGYGDVMYGTMHSEDGGEAFTVSYNVYNTNMNAGTAPASDILRQAFADLDM